MRKLISACILLFLGFSLDASADVQAISSPSGAGSRTPYLISSATRLYMTWLEEKSDSQALKFATYDGRSWSKPSTIVSGVPFFVNWADFPSLLVLKNGMLAAHWLQKSGEGKYSYDVMISVSSNNGKTWTSPVRPHRDGIQGEHGFVSLIPSTSGFEAIWLDSRRFDQTDEHSMKNEMQLMTAVYSNGAFLPETVLDSRVCDCCQTSAAVANGNPIVLYRGRSSSEVRDIYYIRREGNQWSKPKVLYSDNWKIAACPVNGPAVAAQGNKVVATWFTAAGDKPRVYAIFSSDGGRTFGKPVQIDGGNPTGRVDVKLIEDGSALISWLENKGGKGTDIMIRRVKPEGALSPVVIAPSTIARASGFPRIAAWNKGAIIAWTHIGENTSTIKLAQIQ